MHRSIAAVFLVALAALGLAACTASPTPSGSGTATVEAGPDGPGDSGQSTQDACALVRDSVVAAADEFETAAADDPASVVEAMRAAAERLGETASDITNDQVAALVPSLQEMYGQIGDVLEALANADLDQSAEFAELATTFRETMDRFREVCGD